MYSSVLPHLSSVIQQTLERNSLFKSFTATEVNILLLENTFLKDKIQFYNTLSDRFTISQIPLFK